MFKSPVARIILIILTIAIVIALAAVSFGWSFQQTLDYTTSAIGDRWWGLALAVIIQFGPTALLVFGAEARGTAFIVMISCAALLTIIDIWTNVGAVGIMYSSDLVARPPSQEYLGWVLSVAVVAAEEFMSFFIVKTVDQTAQFMEDAGMEPPSWMFDVRNASREATGAPALSNARMRSR